MASDQAIAEFLRAHAGNYLYRPFVRKFLIVLGVICALGGPIMIIEAFSNTSKSALEQIKDASLFLLATFLLWEAYVIGWKFREIAISEDGIAILPLGLSLTPRDMEGIEFGQNFSGLRTIRVHLKAPRPLFHLFAWSFGRSVTIAFNSNLLEPIASSAQRR